jgi:hypothetical protein
MDCGIDVGTGAAALLEAELPPPPAIGRATPKLGRLEVMPGFLPNALTIGSEIACWSLSTGLLDENGKQKRNTLVFGSDSWRAQA